AIPTFDNALALARLDRSTEIAEAMKEFNLAAKEIGPSVTPLTIRRSRTRLENVLKLTPNHLSAKYLLQLADGRFPQVLTVHTAVERIFSIARPILQIASPSRPTYHFTSATYRRVSAKLKPLEPILPRDAKDIYFGVQNFVGTVEDFDTFYEEIPSLANVQTLTAYVQANRTDAGRIGRLEDIIKQIQRLGKAIDKLFTDTDYVKKLWR
ncbi:MAG TPA: hypothetical protein VK970_18105, partial [Candidatus Methylacidiphilales bacterium]|nr:hypothetical protein [Candidatus Methylacidiphilales bacterium]